MGAIMGGTARGGGIGGGFGAPGGGSVSQSQSTSGPSPALLGRYDTAYNTALNFHNQNYQNILGAFSGAAGRVQAGGAAAQSAYGRLGHQVENTIMGVQGGALQNIQDVYAQQGGAAQQQLVNQGLSNTTVNQAVQRGLAYDASKARVNLFSQMAGLRAGYQAQLGSSGIQAGMQGLGMYSGLAGQNLGVLGGQHLPFPGWPPMQGQSTSFGTSMGGGFGGGGGVRGGGGMGNPFDQSIYGSPTPTNYGSGGNSGWGPGGSSYWGSNLGGYAPPNYASSGGGTYSDLGGGGWAQGSLQPSGAPADFDPYSGLEGLGGG